MRRFLKHFPFNKLFVSLFVVLYTFIPSAQAIGVVAEDISTEIDTSEDILKEGISDPAEIANPDVSGEEVIPVVEEVVQEVAEAPFTYVDGVYTVNKVVVNEEYVYPDDSNVKVKFTNITEEGNLVIKRVELTQEEKELLNTSDDYGWDISSSMSNGSFKYDLTLPNNTESKDVEVKYSEDGNTYESIDSNLIVNENVIEIKGLDHFTVFVVVDDDDDENDSTYSDNGWISSSYGYSGDHHYIQSSQTGQTATWTFTGDAGEYAILPSWVIWYDHVINAHYTSNNISNISGSNLSITVDQKQPANSSVASTSPLGTWSGWYPNTDRYNLKPGDTVTLSVESGITDGNLVADAMAFVSLNEIYVNDDWSNMVPGQEIDDNEDNKIFGINAFDTIQEGINAVSAGGTVHVAAGTYQEQVIINKSLTLQGAGSVDTIIKAPDSSDSFKFPGSSSTWKPVVFAFGGTADSATPHNITGSETVQATISGFTVDGNNRVPTGRSAGILLRNVEGTISNNTVRNMYFGEQETFGIVAYGNSNITIKGNNVSEYSRVGIGVNGDLGNLDDPYAVITDNRVTGKGPTDTIVQNGIQIGFGASGLVTGNTVSNNFWTGKYEGEGTNDPATDIEADGAAGILLYMPGNDSIEVSGNTLTANQFGVWTVAATKVDIHNNTITGTDHTEYGYPTGIAIWSADQWTDDFGGSEIGTTGTINNNTITTNDYGLLIRDYNITVGAPAPSITEFNSNTFNNNLYNLDNHSINNIDARNNTWSVSGQNDLDQIEAKINHYCSGSTYVHGTCSITDDYGTGFGMVQYEDIEVPTNSGWNIQSKSATPNETPLDVTCGGYSKENSVAQNWTAVSGENIKYQRKVTYPNGSIGYFNAGGNNYTPFATFGGNPGVEGLWKTRVRTYVDANGNNAPDIGEETSDWSNECNITFDKTAPSAPINGAPNNVSIPTNNFDFTWDASSDAFPVTYEFQSTLNPTESEGVLTTGLWKSGTLSSNMIHSSGASDGKWYWQVRATDLAGNTSAWSSIWNVTLDQIPPSAPTLVSPSHSAIVKGSPTQSWSSTDNDIDHYVYESWKTQETTDPANLIYSNDTLTTTSRTVGGTQNITFWWRVRAVDRAGNESDWSEMRKLIVDNTKPSIEIVSPDENSAHNATFNILVKAEDSGGIGQFVVNIYDGNGKFLSPCVNKSGGGATEYTVTCSIDTTEYTDGTYGIRTNARDLAGNMSNTLSRVFIFDNTFPNIVDTKMYVEREGAWEEDYLAKSGDKVKVSIEVEDALTEVDKVEIWVRENPWDPNHNELVYGYMTKDEDDPTHFEFTYTVPDTYKNGDLINQFFEGNYFNFKPYDILGNSYIGWRKNFTIDNTPPEPPELTGDPIQYVKWGDVTRSWLPSSSPDVDYYMYENITNGWTAGPYYSGQNGYDITHTTGNYDRVFEWRVAAVDYAGNKTWSNEIYEVVVDNTPPANPSLSSPANNLVTRGDVLKNEWSAVDGAYKYIYESYHDEEAQNPRWHEEFDTTSKTAYNVKDATFWWRVKAVDLAGNESGWSYLWKVTVDNTAPVVEITNPSDTDILSGTVDITGYITDKNLSYYNIAIYKGGDNVHDSSLRIEEYTEYTSEFSDKTLHTWDTTNDKFPDGVYQIRLVAEDLAGNGESEGDSEHVISVTVDNTPPVTTLNEEISGIFTNDPIVIEGNTIDNLSGVDFVNLYYNLSSNLVENWILITTVDNPDNDSPFDDWKYTWTPPQEGTYDIKASATDTLGNEEQSAYIYDITYDTTPPEKVIITADQMLGILRDVTASDSLSGVQKIEISPDNINWVPYVLGTDVNLNDLVGNRPGTYKVYIRVTDNAGNTKTETVIFTIPSGETLGLTTKDKDKSPLKPTPVQAYGIGGYPLLSQTDLLDTEEQQTPEEKTITEDTTAVKGEEDINGEPTSEEETTKWWIYPLVILPLLAIFLILWKRRKEDNQPQP